MTTSRESVAWLDHVFDTAVTRLPQHVVPQWGEVTTARHTRSLQITYTLAGTVHYGRVEWGPVWDGDTRTSALTIHLDDAGYAGGRWTRANTLDWIGAMRGFASRWMPDPEGFEIMARRRPPTFVFADTERHVKVNVVFVPTEQSLPRPHSGKTTAIGECHREVPNFYT